MCSSCLSESNKKKLIYDIFIISGDIAMAKSSRDTLYLSQRIDFRRRYFVLFWRRSSITYDIIRFGEWTDESIGFIFYTIV